MGSIGIRTYEFGPFRLAPAEGRLLRNGEPVPLSPKSFEALVLLIERRGRLIDKEELISSLWPDTFVEEANLAHHIWRLRKALDDSKDGGRYIETIPKRGYRFISPIREFEDLGADTAIVIEQHSITRLVAERETSDEVSTPPLGPGEFQLALPRASVRVGWKKITLVAAVGLVLSAGIFFVLRNRLGRTSFTPTYPPIHSLAVLPFKALESDKGDPALQLGMADAVITRLSNIKDLTVRPTSAVLKYAAHPEELTKIGRDLQVDSVLEGRVQNSGDRIRVTVQLVRTEDGKPLWAESFDEKYTNIFALEDAVSAKVGYALAVHLAADDPTRMQQHSTENIEAYQAYLRGRYQMNGSGDGNLKALDSFQDAINRDPNYALAYAGLADVHGALGFMGLGSKSAGEEFTKSKAAAQKALELDPSLADAHTSLGNVLFGYEWNWSAAETEFKRAIELNPKLANAHHWYSEYLQAMEQWDEALAEIKLAQGLDPLSPNINFHLGLCYFGMHRDAEAQAEYRKMLELDPSNAAAHWGLATAYERQGKSDDALRELRETQRLDPKPSWRMLNLAYEYILAGKRDVGLDLLAQVLKLSQEKYISPAAIAQVYAALGNNDEAFKWLDQAVTQRETIVVFFKVMPMGKLRADPRFATLLQRVGLPPQRSAVE